MTTALDGGSCHSSPGVTVSAARQQYHAATLR
jgi:hypothetical protein